MFKNIKTMLVVGITIGLCFSGCGGGGESETGSGKVIELSYSIFFPPTHIQCITADAWAKEIEKTH